MSKNENAQKLSAEPSLSEILSSIKKIIADDIEKKDEKDGNVENLPVNSERTEAQKQSEISQDEDEILNLTELYDHDEDEIEVMPKNQAEEPEVNSHAIDNGKSENNEVNDFDSDISTDAMLELADEDSSEENEDDADEGDKLADEEKINDDNDANNIDKLFDDSEDEVDFNDDFGTDDIEFFDTIDEKNNSDAEEDKSEDGAKDSDSLEITDNQAENNETASDIISSQTDQMISSTFKALTDKLSSHKNRADGSIDESGLQKMLKPMMREWLDSNLPKIVEKLVREEISRVTSKIR